MNTAKSLLAGCAITVVLVAIGVRTVRRISPFPPGFPPHSSVPRLWPVPPFTMTGITSEGQVRITNLLLRDRPWVADFIFTNCGGPCPLMSAKMAGLQEKLPPAVRLVSFTVDPDNDTPKVLQEYARRFKADPRRWVFLRGNKRKLYELMSKGFRLSAAENENAAPGFQITHSTQFVLVDAEGFIRKYYDATDPSALQTLLSDIQHL